MTKVMSTRNPAQRVLEIIPRISSTWPFRVRGHFEYKVISNTQFISNTDDGFEYQPFREFQEFRVHGFRVWDV